MYLFTPRRGVAVGLGPLHDESAPRIRRTGSGARLAVTSAWSNRLVLAVLALFLAPVVEEFSFEGCSIGHQASRIFHACDWGVRCCLLSSF